MTEPCEDLITRLRECYSVKQPLTCKICGKPLIVDYETSNGWEYSCSEPIEWQGYDARSHYRRSREFFTIGEDFDPDVLALLDLIDKREGNDDVQLAIA